MQQPLLVPRDDRATYQYTIQATHDYNDGPPEEARKARATPVWRTGKPPNYKPTPLRWPFLGGVIALLLVAIVLVVVAEVKLPDSDSSVKILGLNPNATQPVRLARAVTNTLFSSLSSTTTLSSALASTTTLSSTTLDGSTTASSTLGTSLTLSGGMNRLAETSSSTVSASSTSSSSLVSSVSSSTTTVSASTSRLSTTATSITSGTGTITATRGFGITALPSGAVLIPVTTSVSKFTSYITLHISTIIFTSTFSTMATSEVMTTSSFATTFVSTLSAEPTTLFSDVTANGSVTHSPFLTIFPTQAGVTTVTSSGTTVYAAIFTFPTAQTVTGTSTITGVVIPVPGEITITSYSTSYPDPGPAGKVESQGQDPGPGKVTGVEEIPGGTVVVVQTLGPVIFAVTSDEARTQVIDQQISTGVKLVGEAVATNIVVVTPTAEAIPSGAVMTVGATPVTIVNNPDPVTALRVVDGVQQTVVETPPPQTVVKIEGGVVTTTPPGQVFTSTIVNNVGGTPVTRVVVTTPVGPPFEPIAVTTVRDVGGGTLVTEVILSTPTGPAGQPITLTNVDIVGGTPVTQVVVTTANAGLQPVSFTITTMVGGTPTVVTFTPAPTTIVETINGTPVTRVTTPPVTSFTTTIGGTLTTQVIVTTPTGTGPITLTLISTSGASLSTFTTTFPATTFLTTISGTVRTITSTPSASTIISTLPKSIHTFTSTSSPTPKSTSPSKPAPTTVIASTRVYAWTEADIFIGTFLPPLLGVALVIPLRIIDLNAKLYQPFQSLSATGARSGSNTGADTLLLKYTGVMAFLTPVVTLLRGHPVPFLTTLMVGCASFMVPLATEAVGLKLHGECWLNTASSMCGPALGVSPAPAHALVALLGAVAVMLAVVMVLVGRWVTGLFANPWSIAGAAALAGSEAVRVRQGGEMAMRRAVADKVYGMGYFQGREGGAEGYGIVLLDEAGRGLHDEEGGSEEGDGELAVAAQGKWWEPNRQLPFMALRYPWRVTFTAFQLAILIFIIYYHAYYRGGIKDDGRLWIFLNSNTFGVRFVAAVVGVVIAFCWQSFFLSVSTMTPFHLLSLRTQAPDDSILFTPSTNPFSGIYSALRHKQPFLLCVSIAAVLSELLPVLLSNVPFNLAQTSTAATVCAVLSCIFLGLMLLVLAASFFVRYPPMPVDPRCIAGLIWYVSRSAMLDDDVEGVSVLPGKERERLIKEKGRRYFYGVLTGDGEGRRLGVDYDSGDVGEAGTEYQGARGVHGSRGQGQPGGYDW
ncbi:Zonadhesin [Staphylotrichum tortipilum]|uniref:Zonadhesin n=1 Tax=Staphylotrichum tortipilum TaxID=2831512 RepID=A0AAN6RW94_9PEZI|nr:Zonadhesin [Staphylotrichum longicolle]